MEIQEKIGIAMDFLKFASGKLNIENLPRVFFTTDKKWAVGLRSFGVYAPKEQMLTVYIGNRNLADILRTLAHELVHHKQNEDGRLQQDSGDTGSGIENEANAEAGVIMREYGKINSIIYESRMLSEAPKYQIYCDMDGVLCDFNAQFDHYFGMTPDEYVSEKGQKAFDNAIDDAGVEFWSTMPWLPGGQELWGNIGKYGVKILSSPGNHEGAKEGKKMWIKKNLNPPPTDIILNRQTGEKHKELMGKTKQEIENSVLIDDYSANLIPWKYLGGKAVKHDNHRNTISKIKGL
jgi:hypothetical protein